MPKYPWIPPAKPRRIPSTRPVTILDTPPAGGGWEYRASYCGIPLQVFSQRPVNGELLQAGETIIARYVPGAGELWFPSPERSPEILYFSPGGLWPEAGSLKGELWKYDGVNPPTLVWTPNFLLYEHPSCLAWCAATQRLYIWTWGYHPVSGDDYHRIYKLNPADDSVTLVLEHNQYGDGYWKNPAMDVAEFPLDGCFYVHFGWWTWGPDARVIVFDPVTETERTAYIYPQNGAPFAYAGGICYHPGTTKLLAFSGYQMYESADGINFILNKDLHTDNNVYDSGPMVLNPTDGKVYLAVEYCDNHGGGAPYDGHGGIMVYDGASWAIDYQYEGSGILEEPPDPGDIGFKAIGNLFDALGVAETVAGYWAWWWGMDRADIHKKTAGAWGLDWPGPPLGEGWCHVSCQTLVSLKGELCALVFDRTAYPWTPPGWYGTRLYKRDALGVYTTIMSWEGYDCEPTYAFTMCMSPVRTARKCHEI